MFSKKGFTLVEVLLVIIIVGVLAAVVIPRITYSRTEAQRQACNANVAAMNSQIELYYAQEGAWPTAISDLVDADYIDAAPTCPLATAYVFNATRNRVEKHVHP